MGKPRSYLSRIWGRVWLRKYYFGAGFLLSIIVSISYGLRLTMWEFWTTITLYAFTLSWFGDKEVEAYKKTVEQTQERLKGGRS